MRTLKVPQGGLITARCLDELGGEPERDNEGLDWFDPGVGSGLEESQDPDQNDNRAQRLATKIARSSANAYNRNLGAMRKMSDDS